MNAAAACKEFLAVENPFRTERRRSFAIQLREPNARISIGCLYPVGECLSLSQWNGGWDGHWKSLEWLRTGPRPA
jgi:hypothetical protein